MGYSVDQLLIYQIAEELELRVFTVTQQFPRNEQYRSVDQLRRSSSSVSNNIAEMYNKRSVPDRIRILNYICRGEIEETRTNLLRCAKKGFCGTADAEAIALRYIELSKAVSGFIRYLRAKLPDHSHTR